MMNNIKSTNLPLILTGRGVKPTVPSNIRAVFGDDDFDVTSDLMVGQQAYNVDDDIWYYRSKKNIKSFGQLPTIPVVDTTDKVFFLTEAIFNLGTSNNDFEYRRNTTITGDYNQTTDTLVVKTPGRYIATTGMYLSKTLHVDVEATDKNLNKVTSIESIDSDIVQQIFRSGIKVSSSSAPIPLDVYLHSPYNIEGGTVMVRQSVSFILTSKDFSTQTYPIMPIKHLWLQFQPSPA